MYIAKRPGLDKFLKTMSYHFELVLFTSNKNNKLTNDIITAIDPHEYIQKRLFYEDCSKGEDGRLQKDLSMIGRSPTYGILLDNSMSTDML